MPCWAINNLKFSTKKKYLKVRNECKNCLHHCAEKISCKHPNWDKCVVRDKNGYVVDYLYAINKTMYNAAVTNIITNSREFVMDK
jgi:hypothetical protein